MAKKVPLKIPLPNVWDRIEIQPAEMSTLTPIPVRVAELRRIDSIRHNIVVTAPDVQPKGVFGIGKMFILRYNISNGVIQTQAKLLETEEEAKVRHWTFDYPEKFENVQRRTKIRVPVFIQGDLDLVHDGMIERRILSYHVSIVELSVNAAIIQLQCDADARLSARSKVYIRFHLPDFGSLGEITGKVLRVAKTRSNAQIQTTATIQFTKMPKLSEVQLDVYCRRREKFLNERTA